MAWRELPPMKAKPKPKPIANSFKAMSRRSRKGTPRQRIDCPQQTSAHHAPSER